eukprot:1209019-Rhodomonas_salina.3
MHMPSLCPTQLGAKGQHRSSSESYERPKQTCALYQEGLHPMANSNSRTARDKHIDPPRQRAVAILLLPAGPSHAQHAAVRPEPPPVEDKAKTLQRHAEITDRQHTTRAHVVPDEHVLASCFRSVDLLCC